MRIRVDEIPAEGQDIEGSIEPSELQLDVPGYRLNEPFTFSGHAEKTVDDVYVEGSLRGAVSSECSRCLMNFKMPLDLDFKIMYVPDEERVGKKVDMIEPDSNLSLYKNDVIDLLREINELVLVSLPLKPICRSDCKGLCPQCGTDLNVSACGCEQSKGPSPFDKLKDLKSRLEKQ
jgi:uncharacterized protein